MDENDPIYQAIDRGGGQTCDALGVVRELHRAGYAIVPIVPSEAMIEELARIGDGPEISAGEVWGYMLGAAKAHV